MLLTPYDDCFSNLNQEFLICTTIHKARQLGVSANETYVRVSLDRMQKTTRAFPNSENPYYNEYFVFEIKCTLSELLRLTILYEVRKRTNCKKTVTVGELLIDMQSVYSQPNRCFFKKWGQLESPIGGRPTPGDDQGRGYLQIDLAIVSPATKMGTIIQMNDTETMRLNKWQINPDYDDIEKNLLQNFDTNVQCNIQYSIVFYRGHFIKKGDYIIQFRFHPFKGKTSSSKSGQQPEWNQEVNFAWSYPSLAQTFLIQVLLHEHLQWKCIAEYELHFNEIAFKDKPCLGPTYLHLYDSLNAVHYVGRILCEVRSTCLKEDVKRRELVFKAVPAIDVKRWWQEEEFMVEFMVLQGDFIHATINNCRFQLKFAENTSNYVECLLKGYSSKHQNSGSNLKYFKQELPYKSVALRATVPDNRHKFESDFFMQEMLDYMKTEIETFKLFQLKYTNQLQMHAKCLKAIIMSILAKLKDGQDAKRLEYSGFKDPTQWDTNRHIYLQDFFTKLPDDLRVMRQRLKLANQQELDSTIEDVLQELLWRTNDLKNLLITTRIQDEWPDILIMMIAGKSTEIGVCRLNSKYFLDLPKDKDRDKEGNLSNSNLGMCWRVRNFVFKDVQCQHSCINCGCTIAIVQGCLSIVVERERPDYVTHISNNWKQAEQLCWNPTVPFTMYKCRLFIHQAKIRPGSDRTGLCDSYLRMIFCGQVAETIVQRATLSPIWNVVICFEGILLPGDMNWYAPNPPLVTVELYDMDKQIANDYLGCGVLSVSVVGSERVDTVTREEPESTGVRYGLGMVKTKNALQKFQQLKSLSPPPLKWLPVAIKGTVRAEVLMSAELVEVHDELNENISPEPTTTFGIPNGIRPNMRNFVLEVVFVGFRNYNSSTLSAGRHRVKVMMGDLLLMSGLSTNRIKNSINFLVLYASGVVSLPEQLEYWPAIIATDVVVSSRGSETTIGAVLIPNCKRFLQRDNSTGCPPIVETDMESSEGSTACFVDENKTMETSPLLRKDGAGDSANGGRNNRVMGLFGAFKTNNSMDYPRQWLLSRNGFARGNQRQYAGRDSAPINESDLNWWSKFYNSMYTSPTDTAPNFKHRLTIYTNELERQSEFSYFHDWAEPVRLVHGMMYKKNALPKEESYATLKLHLKLTPCQCGNGDVGDGAMLRPLAAALNPKYQEHLQTLAELCKIIARVYVVQGMQFRPHDRHSQSDLYVRVQLGNKTLANRAHYVPNQSNPIFGKCFQLEGTLPRDHMLEISVFNRSLLHDEIIGSTFIDLEDRWRTKHRATVAIPEEYSSTGYNVWRDIPTPSEILTDLCLKRDIKPPVFNGGVIEVDGQQFTDETRIATNEDLRERLSLTVLRNFEKLPSFGYKLVPEHVETRSLYRGDCPGIEQGKIQLWIELFEGNLNIPPAMDITPIPPQMYELRVTVYNCSDIVTDEKNIFNKRMSDIFVKCWCQDAEQVQYTDTHYRSVNGEAMFNWRMVFPLKYSTVEDMMVIKRKGSFTEEYELKQPPILYVQVFDNDVISRDDFLGAIEINLSNFMEPFVNAKSCYLPDESSHRNFLKAIPFVSNIANSFRGCGAGAAGSGGVGGGGDGGGDAANGLMVRRRMNVFREKKIRGWFPLKAKTPKLGELTKEQIQPPSRLAGKINLELEILSDTEAAGNPAGLGRSPPNALPEPTRPDTSFNPWLNPRKTLTKVVWPAIRKYVIVTVLVVGIVFAMVMIFAVLPYEIFHS